MTFRFGPFTVDLDTRQLTRDGANIHISPKAFELLVALAVERPKVLSKAVLQQRLWPETFVAEANLSNLVAEIREALGDSSRAPVYIRTAHGFGYAFSGEATTERAVREAAPGRSLGVLCCGFRSSIGSANPRIRVDAVSGRWHRRRRGQFRR